MLHKIETKGWEANTAWCVPTAVSLLSGAPLIHTHSRAAFLQDKALTDVKGVYCHEAILLLHEQGYRVEEVKLDEPVRFLEFMKNHRTPYQKCLPMMICIEKKSDFCHMIAAHFDYVADNWTMKPVTFGDYIHKRSWVVGAWTVIKKG